VGTQPAIDDWAVPVAPYDGESLSHYLGRYRRANTLSASMLGRLTGLGGVIARWEKLYHNPLIRSPRVTSSRRWARSSTSITTVSPRCSRRPMRARVPRLFACAGRATRWSHATGSRGRSRPRAGAAAVGGACFRNAPTVEHASPIPPCGRPAVARAADCPTRRWPRARNLFDRRVTRRTLREFNPSG